MIGFCEEDYVWLRQHMRIPFVAYDASSEANERFCNLNIDNFSGGYQVGQHFRELGHKQVLCISDNDTCIDWERYLGFRAGFSGGDFLMIPMEKKARERLYQEKLAQIRKYTAIFAVSDYYAVDLIRFFSTQGIQVPRDVSVAGFDDTPLCTQVTPSLTSVRQDGALRARTAMEQLLELKTGKEEGETITLPVNLVLRESTSPV